jgi:aldose 1-epimerase
MVGEHGPALELTYLSKDGEEGFPGNLTVTATYTSRKTTRCGWNSPPPPTRTHGLNLTHHSYFNLARQGRHAGHVVYINADKFTPVDAA